MIHPPSTIYTTSIKMVRVLAMVVFIIAFGTGSTFSDENPIRQVVSDGLPELEASVVQVIGHTPHALTFARFAHRYEKKYETSDEMKQRYSIFVESLETITTHNNKGLSYTLGVNEFADMTWEEFSKNKLGASQNCSATKKGNHKLTQDVLPLTQDWRKAGIVSPVKNQGSCGSCWTFSTTGALEAAYAQAYGKKVSLSEQQLVDCAGDFNNSGCKGGLPSHAYEYILYNGGLDFEEAYPYTAKPGLCKYSPDKAAVQVVNVVNITQGAEDELKHAVGVVRPVSVTFQVVPPFTLYTGGVFTSDICASGPMNVNHAVVAVGYGVENGVPYWLIKNSWGAKWGLNGYFKMEMGKNMCGIAACASYPGGCDSDDDGGGEVQSLFKGSLNNLSDLEDALVVKRGISTFYSGKSKSYTSLADAVSVPSIQDIVKPEDAYNRKRKNMLAHSVMLNKNRNFTSKSGISIANTGLMANGLNNIHHNNAGGESSSPLPPLPARHRISPVNESLSSAPRNHCSPWRSFSLSDLQHAGGCGAASSFTGNVRDEDD
ncbi:hypothetical protein L1987_14086 [Smallanthus sonchifolius]|uniref:Uncharacterized protein n=1 Tax=Smallanthus sonchifolius TaxID=185202 RepID=A0ACB9J2V7_9ASTR|nr:hypothetical protein L1987_14086 [Smallanthus sonchifolius]